MELQPMAGLWLAPVQANGLGHPETSGLPTMTHALSSELMEPADGENHYSERLVRLPHTASCYHLDRIRQDLARVSAPEREAGRINFLCSQNLQKYLPRHDHVFADIAADLPTARFNFIAREGEGRAVFERRLARAFQARGLEAETFCRLHPGLDVEGYLRLNLACDVFLDGISWSGNNTTHEAIACGLPVVTWPGKLMRARHSAALLQRLELTETVADSAEGYVALAVQLGCDAGQRAYLKAEMATRIGRLFDDPAPIRGLEKFLRQVTG
jgi:predicted O-linked N-acetylglucosamine transferase (SPINDLY family)